jgi:hypothetical protein
MDLWLVLGIGILLQRKNVVIYVKFTSYEKFTCYKLKADYVRRYMC